MVPTECQVVCRCAAQHLLLCSAAPFCSETSDASLSCTRASQLTLGRMPYAPKVPSGHVSTQQRQTGRAPRHWGQGRICAVRLFALLRSWLLPACNFSCCFFGFQPSFQPYVPPGEPMTCPFIGQPAERRVLFSGSRGPFGSPLWVLWVLEVSFDYPFPRHPYSWVAGGIRMRERKRVNMDRRRSKSIRCLLLEVSMFVGV